MDNAQIAEVLRNGGLGDYVEAILPYAKPCIRLYAHPADDPDSLPPGSSCIGGLPDMPPNAKWPTRNGRLCEFIAQINLGEASQYDETGLLPKEGMLLFFYDGREYEDKEYKPYQIGSETIIYYTGDITSLERASDIPESLEDWQRYRACTITFEADWILPGWYASSVIALERDVFQYQHTGAYDTEPPLVKAYWKLTHDIIPPKDEDIHHLLGYPEPIMQDDPLYHVPGVWDGQKLDEEELARWMLLLQISSDDGPGMLWGDTSSLYYCIRKDDLIARRFDSAICVAQSY